MNQPDPINYLKGRLTDSARANLTAESLASVKELGLEEWLYRTLTRKPYRKWSIPPEGTYAIREAINNSINQQKPIRLTFFFGGYKLWRFSGSPEVDWAEFFTLCYYAEYLAPVVFAYPPGVQVTFWSAHPSIMRQMSNISETNSQRYYESFQSLLGLLRVGWPNNFLIELRSVSELYPDAAEYEAELHGLTSQLEQHYKTLTTERRQKKITTSSLNIQWSGNDDWSKLSEKERQGKIERGPIIHDAYCRLTKLKSALRGLGKIVISTTPLTLPSTSIALGSTKNSITKFWTGTGVLEERPDGFRDRILSPQQLEQVKSMEARTIDVDLIPLKNFSKIMIFPELRFS